MKRGIRLLARLYPSAWRERYGAEFDALLEDATLSLPDALDVLWGALKMQITTWRFARIVFVCTVAGLLVAIALTFAVPAHYSSQATLTVVPVRASTHESIDDLVKQVEDHVFSKELLASIIQKRNLYPRERSRIPLDAIIEKMRQSVRIESAPPVVPRYLDAASFVIQFDYPQPRVAQQVDEELLSNLMWGCVKVTESDSHFGANFYVFDPPSLPSHPAAPNRNRFAIVGLFSGLLAGLTFAMTMKWRRASVIV